MRIRIIDMKFQNFQNIYDVLMCSLDNRSQSRDVFGVLRGHFNQRIDLLLCIRSMIYQRV